VVFVNLDKDSRKDFETDADGILSADLAPGSYELHVQSTGVESIPNKPFLRYQVEAPGTHTLKLPTIAGSGSMGWLDASVKTESGASVSGVLVVAEGVGANNSDAPVSFAHTDGSGLARIPNLPQGDYSIRAHGHHVHTAQVQSASITSGAGIDTLVKVYETGLVDLSISSDSSLPDGVVFELYEPLSWQSVPEVEATLSAGIAQMTSVAPSTYGIRVQDPAWVINVDDLAKKPHVSVKVSANGQSSFDVVGSPSIPLLAPVDGKSTGLVPLMQWVAEAGVDFYVVEVRAQNREIVYGGFAADGTPRLTIPSSFSSLAYGSLDYLTPGVAAEYVPRESLKTGHRYRWRVFACVNDSSALKGYRAVQASHYTTGVFVVDPERFNLE
jgi:hypothetical protein